MENFFVEIQDAFVYIPIILLLVTHFANKHLVWYKLKISKLKRRFCSNRKETFKKSLTVVCEIKESVEEHLLVSNCFSVIWQ